MVLLLSFLITWSIGLVPPILIRFVFMRRPLGKGWTIGVVAILWAINIVIFTALGSQSKTHGALALVAFISYGILRKGAKNKATNDPTVEYEEAYSENTPTISNSTNYDKDDVYDQIAEEFENGIEDKGLWTRLFADCDGDETKTKVLYIKKRAERLIVAQSTGMDRTTQEAPSNIDNSNKKKKVLNDNDDIGDCPKCGTKNRIKEISIGFIQKCDKCGNVEYFKEKKMDDTSWQDRVLCSDGSCIGVIGKNGRCKTCGKKGEIEISKK